MNTPNFPDAYRTLVDAKTAAQTAAVDGARTGNVEVMQLASERVAKASAEFREAYNRTFVETGIGPIFRTEYKAIEKLAQDNGYDLRVIDNGILAVTGGRISEFSLGMLSLKDISAIAGLTSLTSLTLQGNQITDISALAGLTALRELILFANQITDISILANLTALEILNIEANKITDIAVLKKLTALTTLWIRRNPLEVSESTEQTLKALRSINCIIDGVAA